MGGANEEVPLTSLASFTLICRVGHVGLLPHSFMQNNCICFTSGRMLGSTSPFCAGCLYTSCSQRLDLTGLVTALSSSTFCLVLQLTYLQFKSVPHTTPTARVNLGVSQLTPCVQQSSALLSEREGTYAHPHVPRTSRTLRDFSYLIQMPEVAGYNMERATGSEKPC